MPRAGPEGTETGQKQPSMHLTRKVGYGRVTDVTGSPDRALNGLGDCRLAAFRRGSRLPNCFLLRPLGAVRI